MIGSSTTARALAAAGIALAVTATWAARWAPARAERPQQERDALAAVIDADPLELARVVDRIGDAAVIERLDPGQPVEVRLAAIRAAPWMREPELGLDALARELSGRDSELAPSAALSAERVASAIGAAGLVEREVDPAGLAAVRARLAAAGKNGLLRPDIRLYAAQAADKLAAASVPLP